MPCTAMNAADSGPPKPALALLARRGVSAWEVGRVEASSGEPTATVLP